MNLRVKYGLITLINSKQDLCEQMKNVDEECPLEGEKVIKKDVELPKEIPKVHSLCSVPFALYFGLTNLIGRESTLYLQTSTLRTTRRLSALKPLCISDRTIREIRTQVAAYRNLICTFSGRKGAGIHL